MTEMPAGYVCRWLVLSSVLTGSRLICTQLSQRYAAKSTSWYVLAYICRPRTTLTFRALLTPFPFRSVRSAGAPGEMNRPYVLYSRIIQAFYGVQCGSMRQAVQLFSPEIKSYTIEVLLVLHAEQRSESTKMHAYILATAR